MADIKSLGWSKQLKHKSSGSIGQLLIQRVYSSWKYQQLSWRIQWYTSTLVESNLGIGAATLVCCVTWSVMFTSITFITVSCGKIYLLLGPILNFVCVFELLLLCNLTEIYTVICLDLLFKLNSLTVIPHICTVICPRYYTVI